MEQIIEEEWRPVVGYKSTHRVSNLGGVWALERISARGHRLPKRVLHPSRLRSGHLTVSLTAAGKKRTVLVHRLVLEAFVGTCPPGSECRHLNGDPSDNRVENLAWGTRKENMHDKVAHGTDHNSNKTHCNHGHRLIAPNVRNSHAARGHRICKACHRENSSARYYKVPFSSKEADRQYERIMKEVSSVL